jgi:hypothetical protein
MPVINKQSVKAPLPPEPRVVAVPELGGEVIVRPLGLSNRLAMHADVRAMNGNGQAAFAHIAALLAHAVVDEHFAPIFTAEEWEAWGADNMGPAMMLWDAAFEVSGLDKEDAEKKSVAQNSSSQ